MKRKLGVALGTVLALGAAYMGGVGYYAEKFTPNTSIGSVNIGNLTLPQAQEALEKAVANRTITLTENGKEVGAISLASLGYHFDTQEVLNATYQAQDPLKWALSFFEGTKLTRVLANQVDIESSTLESLLAENNINNEDRQAAVDAAITYEEGQGYSVVPGQAGTAIDMSSLSDLILEAVEDGSNTVDLSQAYAQPSLKADSPEITEFMDRIQDILDTKITLEIAGEEITIPAEEIESWVYFDANNQVVVDHELASAYLEDLNAQYATAGTSRVFQSTLKGEVEVPAGILGWSIDIEQEIANIQADLQKGQDVTRPAAFTGVGNLLGQADDIGSTYVEVDLDNQMMYLYVDGEIMLATNIVSGRRGAETIPGANAVIEMLQDTDLVGYNQFTKKEYKVPVSYWIRFDYQAQGIHDATWQGAFGGSQWVESGSLGCINTPLDQVALLYQYVEMGTPVIVH